MTTGERIRERRREIGMSADELADAIGVSRSTMFRYEQGFIEKIPYLRLMDIAKALRTTWGDLMGLEDKAALPVTGESGKEAALIMENLSPEKQAKERTLSVGAQTLTAQFNDSSAAAWLWLMTVSPGVLLLA